MLPDPPPGPERPPEPDIALVLRPLKDDVPADHRLKQLLKVALRRFKFRVVGCTDIAPPKRQDARSGHNSAPGGSSA